ncbi:hypothetical protein QYE76_063851 [Lolium multiflorum]|uniref:Large ribosomal subunit protein uL18 C-terminal eukaryotes domain-containing protein n=1 Tax=Lolium multiflorum TaxID=4521 RepID=A0AAD8S733_LOLMU|nr:hypothetical protein QYE76_063851 [Lolium multiflorum]
MQALPVVLNKRLRFSAVFKGDILFLVNFCAILFPILAEQEPQRYQFHFRMHIKKEISTDDMEAIYNNVHAAIRPDPTLVKSTKEAPKTQRGNVHYSTSSGFGPMLITAEDLARTLEANDLILVDDGTGFQVLDRQ